MITLQSGTRSSALDPSLIYETDHAHKYPKAKFLLDDGEKPEIPFSEEKANSLFGKAKYVKIKKRTTNPKKDQAKPYEIVYRIIDPKELAGKKAMMIFYKELLPIFVLCCDLTIKVMSKLSNGI